MEENMAKSIGLIIKPSRKCNLRCSYCQDWRQRDTLMSFDILANLTAKALQAKEVERVDFIWHGGEPLLHGIDFYVKAIELQRHFAKPNQRIKNSIQTNGTDRKSVV